MDDIAAAAAPTVQQTAWLEYEITIEHLKTKTK